MYRVVTRLRRRLSNLADKAMFGFYTIGTLAAAGYYGNSVDDSSWHFAATLAFIALGSLLALRSGRKVAFGY